MDLRRDKQLAEIVDSHDFDAVTHEVAQIFRLHYSPESVNTILDGCRTTRDLFEGRYPGYRRCYAGYHDLRHTLDVALTTVRLLDGHNLSSESLSENMAEALVQAALLHDTGYIQEEWDTEGTGAKYSQHHEQRSIGFVEAHARQLGIESSDLPMIARFIQSTDLKVDEIAFVSDVERAAGAILGSADLMAQMADREYLEKLLFLYYEFREAGVPGYDTEFDILRNTKGFYQTIKTRLSDRLMGVQTLVRHHFRERHQTDVDLYQVAIARQMDYLDQIIADETTNFRHKLKRVDLDQLSSAPS